MHNSGAAIRRKRLSSVRTRLASLARDWVDTLTPKGLGSVQVIAQAIIEWEQGNQPLSSLWSRLAKVLGGAGLLDSAREAGMRAVAEDNTLVDARTYLAVLEYLAGNDQNSKKLAHACLDDNQSELEVLFILEELTEQPEHIGEISSILVESSPWGEFHNRFIRILSGHNNTDLTIKFLAAWLNRFGYSRHPCMYLAIAFLTLHRYREASPLLCNIWQNSPDATPYIGSYLTVTPPDRQAEETLRRRVLTALNQKGDDFPVFPLDDTCTELPETVLYLGQVRTNTGEKNDLAYYLEKAAASVNRVLLFDSGDGLFEYPRARISDAERALRLDALLNRIRAIRPQLIIVDCYLTPMLGDLHPRQVIKLKAEIGCRVLCMFRDAQTPTMGLVRFWAEAADGLVLTDPLSPVFTRANADLAAKAGVIPLPISIITPVSPVRGVLFMGSVAQFHRPMLIGSLLEADLDLTVIVGNERFRVAPTEEAYLAMVATSRAVLNIAVHAPGELLMTGRCFQTIATGSLLLEQEGSALDQYFAPYRHYIPWNTPGDIITAYRLILREDHLRQGVIDSAQNWHARHYPIGRVWLALMKLAFDPASYFRPYIRS